MLETQHLRDLAGSEQGTQHQWSWILQRFAWAIMALVILGALFGLFGNGVLSHTTAGQRDGQLWLEYHRFWRSKSPMTVQVNAGPETVHNNEVHLWIGRSYLEHLTIQHVTPQPERVVAKWDRLMYVFNVDESNRPVSLTFNVQPESFGSLRGQIGVQDGPEINFDQFIYP